VLDGDDADAPLPVTADALGFFTWTRRHIESYLLVPEAIARSLGLRVDDRRLQHFFDAHVPAASDAEAWRRLDAKRLLGERGAFSHILGRSLPLARVARATRLEELHADVLSLFEHLQQELAPQTFPRSEGP